MGAHEGIRRRHDHWESRASGRVFTRCPPACVTRPLSPLLHTQKSSVVSTGTIMSALPPRLFFFLFCSRSQPDDGEAIDKDGAQGPSGHVPSLATL